MTDNNIPAIECTGDPDVLAEQYSYAMNMIDNNASIEAVFDFVLGALDERLRKDLYPHGTCTRGCSHCCNISVGVTAVEARYIEAKTGHKANYNQKTEQNFFNVPCVFLKQGECSIYPYRPITCRVFTSLEDPARCEGNDKPHYFVAFEAPTKNKRTFINLLGFNTIINLCLREKQKEFGDIRQYFGA